MRPTYITDLIIPPSLFGIDRRIAYAYRTYHSGWIYTGDARGFAGVKLSGSPRIQVPVGLVSIIMIMIANPRMSFPVKYGWIGILSVFLFNPSWLFEPVWFRNSRWIIVIAAIANGIRKCNAKIVLGLRYLRG